MITDGFRELPYRPWPKDAVFDVSHIHENWLDLVYIRADGVRVYLCSKPAPRGTGKQE